MLHYRFASIAIPTLMQASYFNGYPIMCHYVKQPTTSAAISSTAVFFSYAPTLRIHPTHPTLPIFKGQANKAATHQPCGAISFTHFTFITFQGFVALHHLSLISAYSTTTQQQPYLISFHKPSHVFVYWYLSLLCYIVFSKLSPNY